MAKSPSGKGFGGGKSEKKPKQPTTTPDSGQSTSIAEVLGVVSEGEIEGPINGAQGIYLDKTPVQNADGSLNFSGFQWDWRSGTQYQDRIAGYGDEVTSETGVGVEVKHNLPITRTIINKSLDAIRVRLGFVLQEFRDDGSTYGSSLLFRIWIKEGNSAFVLRHEQTALGRFSSTTEFEYQFPVNNYGGSVDAFQIRIERLTPTDTDTNKFQRQMQCRSLTEIIETKLSYPNSAYFALRFDAAQFDSIPEIAYLIGGRKVAIPKNGTVSPVDGAVDYNGLWDGTFYTPAIACSDPAWILWDLLTNSRYGLGRYLNSSNLDKWSLYAISQYCNQIIPNGFGGLERRFLINFLLEGKDEAYNVIEAIRSVFRGFSYWMQGAIHFVADQPGSPAMQFTQADIEDGMFSYSSTGLKARHTVALVTWNDPQDFYSRTTEVVEDPEAIAMYGIRELEISAFGCNSRGQARRAGLAALLAERIESETVTFRVRAYGAYCTPGMIIKVMDAKRATVRYGGLVVAIAGSDIITLDSPIEIEPASTNLLTLMLPDGSITERTIMNTPGVYTTVRVTPPFTSPPAPESNWILSTAIVQPQLFRVLNRAPVPGSNEMVHEITALEYRGDKYNSIEQGWQLQPLSTRRLIPAIPPPPTNLYGNPRVVGEKFMLDIAWNAPLDAYGSRNSFIRYYLIELKVEGGEWGDTITVVDPKVAHTYSDIPVGVYYYRIASVDLAGTASNWVESGAIRVTADLIADFRLGLAIAILPFVLDEDLG